ncbi:GNAT family N-acetyltransferase [Candidatus Pantoea deserta]|uniref:GNAT family N-acetyltransferase n=1 Tax=Candidatus Pantoea deserta TaxID=1869313 RepID=A0A3N4NJT8_9GAMM|nr:GNAT family N-acetyltransferase [Pantoea deserta]RPD94677.1 GNAT family N-acetyltransferase [Pantoea deserta]
MTDSFRQLGVEDTPAYYPLVHAAYASARELGIKFDAATADAAQMQRHIATHGVYGMFRDGELVASVTLRYPWGPLPGPFGLPHIGWFATAPHYRGQRLGALMLDWLEQAVLRDVLRAPAYSLGTAESHPWLIQLYETMGFEKISKKDLGKGHITVYMKKTINLAQAR